MKCTDYQNESNALLNSTVIGGHAVAVLVPTRRELCSNVKSFMRTYTKFLLFLWYHESCALTRKTHSEKLGAKLRRKRPPKRPQDGCLKLTSCYGALIFWKIYCKENGIPVPERLLYKQIASLAVILSEETIAKYPARQSSFSISEAFSSANFSVTPSFS